MRLLASSSLVFAAIMAVATATLTTSYAKTPTPSAVVAQQTTTPVGIPAAPSEAALIGGAELFWQDNSNNETGFHITIRVSGSPSHASTYNAAANATSFLLPADAPHVCEKNGGPALFGSVVAVDARGESAPADFGLFAVCEHAPSPVATVRASGTPTPQRSSTPVAVPAAPSSLLLLGGAQLLWSDNSNNETGFRITIFISGESAGRQATYEVPANITSVLLPSDAPHVCEQVGDFGINFAVVAFNGAGSSEMARSGIASECGEPAIAPPAEVHLPSTGAGSTSRSPNSGAVAWLVVLGSCLIVGMLSASSGLTRRR